MSAALATVLGLLAIFAYTYGQIDAGDVLLTTAAVLLGYGTVAALRLWIRSR